MAGANRIESFESFEVFTDQLLGAGTFGKVFKGVFLDGNKHEDVAIKKIEIPEDPEFDEKYLKGEVEALTSVEHKNIVRLYHSERLHKHLYIILEYCVEGDLDGFIAKNVLSQDIMLGFLQESADAINHLHCLDHPIVHRDLKPANLLVQKYANGIPTIKVTDFGVASNRLDRETMTICGTPDFMAAEIRPDKDGHVKYTTAVDVFALGLIYLAIINHQSGEKLQTIKVQNQPLGTWIWMREFNGLPVPLPEVFLSTDTALQVCLKSVAAQMIHADPKQRPKMQNICDLIVAIKAAHGEHQISNAEERKLTRLFEAVCQKQDTRRFQKALNKWKIELSGHKDLGFILDACQLIPAADEETMPKHKLHLAYNVNKETKALWCSTIPELDCSPLGQHKTIMVVGATGAGKSKLIDALVNHVLGVTWKDPFRFTIIDRAEEEKKRNENQAVAQMLGLTTYVIHPYPGSRFAHELLIVDMPGFEETHGNDDRQLVGHLRSYILSPPENVGYIEIDHICFVVPAHHARLTSTENPILKRLKLLFDNITKDNTTECIIFPDDKKPREAKVCARAESFGINNSALFAVNDSPVIQKQTLWNIMHNNYAQVIDALKKMELKSIPLSKNILDECKQKGLTIRRLRQEFIQCLGYIDTREQHKKMLKENKQLKDNNTFTYTVEETKYDCVKTPAGVYFTNCLLCNQTCHYPCNLQEDSGKWWCKAIRLVSGNCTVCTNTCHWKVHTTFDHTLKPIVQKSEKTYEEMKKRYKEALKGSSAIDDIIGALCQEIDDMQAKIHKLGKEIIEHINWLQRYASGEMPPHTLIEFYTFMIQAENRDKNEGYQKRAKMLRNARDNCN